MSRPSDTTAQQAFWGRIARFAVAGGAATLTYLCLGLLLVRVFDNLALAHGAAYVASLIVSYFGQKYWTFRVRGGHARFGARFILSTAVLGTAAILLTWGLRSLGVRSDLVIVANTITYPLMSFVLHNAWTFKPKPAA